MPFTYYIDEEKKIAEVKGHDLTTLRECVDIIISVAEDEKFQSDFKAIVDMLDMQYDDLTSIDVSSLTSIITSRKAIFRNKIALIVTNQLVFFANLSSTIVQATGIKMNGFIDKQEAIEWLASED